ncbi:MAG: hypothetical protein LBC09_00195 [Helicobacteraceae bacterium]|jgi:hypothetical protein|nr:hypothetical protein [Helicobacteraceae bacterium]
MELKEMVLAALADMQEAQEREKERIIEAAFSQPNEAPALPKNAETGAKEAAAQEAIDPVSPVSPAQAQNYSGETDDAKEPIEQAASAASVSQSPIAPQQQAAADGESDQISDRARDEAKFLSAVKERLLVLFEGFQSPNNKAVEAKVDLTLNFLEYLLSAIEERLDELKLAN